MMRFPSWTWLFTKSSALRSRRAPEARPCLAAVELLDDRVLLSATSSAVVAPPQASDHAVQTFLKWESDFLKYQEGVLKTEIQFLKNANDPSAQADASYFLKLDSDLSSVDAGLIGSPANVGVANAAASSNSVGGIDGALVGNYLKFADVANADALKIQTEITLMANLQSQLATVASGGGGGAGDAVDAYLKLEQLKYKEQGAASELNATFLKLETAFVGTDLGSSITSLGNTIAPLTTDTAPQNPPAFDAFLKFEEGFIKLENAFLKIEADYIKLLPSGSPAVTAEFLKLDNDFLKIDVDLVGTPQTVTTAAVVVGGSNGGGINGVLLNSNLPADVISEIRDKWSPALSNAQSTLNADISALQPLTTSVAASVHPSLENGRFKLEGPGAIHELEAGILKFETSFLAGDPNRPLVDTLVTDLKTLAADASKVIG